jgi:aminopeptidase N
LQVVAHELGHQFFGNLVTCKTWDYTWLNEGFATLFEFLLVENLNPDLRIRDFFNVNKVKVALRVDSVETTHAMSYGGETISETIYDKGLLKKEVLLLCIIYIERNFSWKCHPNVPKRCRGEYFP